MEIPMIEELFRRLDISLRYAAILFLLMLSRYPLFLSFLSCWMGRQVLGGFWDSWGMLDLITYVSFFNGNEESSQNSNGVPVLGPDFNGNEESSQNSNGVPVLGPEPQTLENVRAEHANVEAQLFSRIRHLEAQLHDRIPPQLNPGEYEGLVRSNLENAVTIQHYHEVLQQELIDVTRMELKFHSQEKLFQLMISEPQLEGILNKSPYNDIRQAAFDFIEEKVEPVSSMRFPFQEHIYDGTLYGIIQDVESKGAEAPIYKEFLSFFKDERFRFWIDKKSPGQDE